jgi:hypothetical protein
MIMDIGIVRLINKKGLYTKIIQVRRRTALLNFRTVIKGTF